MSDPDPSSSDTSKPNNGGSTAPTQVNDRSNSSSTATMTNAEQESTATADHCLSPEEFQSWLLQRLQQNHVALYGEYPQVFESAAAAIANWRRRFHGDAAVWKRLFDEKKIIKEFVEACPIIDAVQRLVAAAAYDEAEEPPFTIVDLACGKGYLSMLLSEMLPPSQVTRFVLIDKAWACHGTTELSAHHMNWDHIHDPKYKDSWPIPLVPCKQDLKSGRQRRKLQDYYFDNKSNNNNSNVILLAVHLCGTLSLKAVDFFNQNANISFFCLKPCCLPGMIHAKRHEIFTLTSKKQCNDQKNDDDDNNNNIAAPPSSNNIFQHSFPAKSVCMHGKWKKNKWQGPPRQSLIPYFQTWTDNLFLGIAAMPVDKTTRNVKSGSLRGGGMLNDHGSDGTDKSDHNNNNNNNNNNTAMAANGDQQEQSQSQSPSSSSCCLTAQKLQRTIMVQIDGGYQNQFLFAQRFPTTAEVWEALM